MTERIVFEIRDLDPELAENVTADVMEMLEAGGYADNGFWRESDEFRGVEGTFTVDLSDESKAALKQVMTAFEALVRMVSTASTFTVRSRIAHQEEQFHDPASVS